MGFKKITILSMNIDKSHKFSSFFQEFAGQRQIDILVLHHVEANSVEHAIEQFKHFGVSSHFIIDENGKVYELVDENNVAYHAGHSYWHGLNGLNSRSIGIEFINKSPFAKKFTEVQMRSGLELCRYLIAKYNIAAQNIVGHSDIAFDAQTGLLDRKQDPSELFDWHFLAQNGVGLGVEINFDYAQDKKLFELGDKDLRLVMVKQKLAQFGYKLTNFNEEFDQEMMNLVRVFNRRFNPKIFAKHKDVWMQSSQLILDLLVG